MDAHLGRRGHHRHVRRAALRRLAHALPLQGQVPPDGDASTPARSRKGGDERAGALPPHRARAGGRLRARRRARKRASRCRAERSSAGRETTDQIFFQRLTYGRVDSARGLHRAAAAATPQTFNSFYADDSDIAFVTTGRLPMRPQGRQRRPAGRRPRAGSSGRASCAASQAPAGRQPGERAARQLEQQAGARTSRPATTAGTRAARSASTGCSRELARTDEAHAGDRARRRERGARPPTRAA